MRREPTDAERKLWAGLRARRFQSLKFRRQVPVGRYIVDFLCLEHKLVVELDGAHHAESVRDQVRDAYLVSCGYRVLRFWNHQVFLERESVFATIATSCGLAW